MYRIDRASLEDARHVALHMRRRDVQEVRAASGLGPFVALRRALEESEAATLSHDGVPFAIFGCGPTGEAGWGCPWLLATDDWSRHIKFVLRSTPAVLEAMHGEYGGLVNYVDARHLDSVRYLKWAGFTLDPPAPYGYEGRAFHKFYKVKQHV